MLKGSRRGRVSELSGAFFSLFNFASFGNGGIPRAPVANSFPRTNGTLPHQRAVPEEGTGSCSLPSAGYQDAKGQLRANLLIGMTASFMTAKQTLFPMASVFGAASVSSGTP